MLIGHAEQMAFVVEVDLTFRLHEQETIDRTQRRLQRGAAGNQGVGAQCLLSHPGDNLFLCHRLFGGFHGKSGRKHFRQYNHVAPDNLFHLPIKVTQVGWSIHPDQGLL